MVIDMSRKDFIEEALKGNGVQNDGAYVWVVVNGIQCTVTVDDVLGREENEPFEASDYLESNLDVYAWEYLYEQYCEQI